MARYFFHLRNHTDELLDLEGTELTDIDAAQQIALDTARKRLSAELRSGKLDLRYRIDVENGTGTVVHSLRLREAFEVTYE